MTITVDRQQGKKEKEVRYGAVHVQINAKED